MPSPLCTAVVKGEKNTMNKRSFTRILNSNDMNQINNALLVIAEQLKTGKITQSAYDEMIKAYTDRNKNADLSKKERKARKARVRMHTVYESEENLLRFVTFKYAKYKRVNGGFKFLGYKKGRGLRYQNKIFTTKTNYVFTNRKTIEILKKSKFGTIPKWASPELVELYEELKKTLPEQITPQKETAQAVQGSTDQ